jgi:hypothetical protein
MEYLRDEIDGLVGGDGKSLAARLGGIPSPVLGHCHFRFPAGSGCNNGAGSKRRARVLHFAKRREQACPVSLVLQNAIGALGFAEAELDRVPERNPSTGRRFRSGAQVCA